MSTILVTDARGNPLVDRRVLPRCGGEEGTTVVLDLDANGLVALETSGAAGETIEVSLDDERPVIAWAVEELSAQIGILNRDDRLRGAEEGQRGWLEEARVLGPIAAGRATSIAIGRSCPPANDVAPSPQLVLGALCKGDGRDPSVFEGGDIRVEVTLTTAAENAVVIPLKHLQRSGAAVQLTNVTARAPTPTQVGRRGQCGF